MEVKIYKTTYQYCGDKIYYFYIVTGKESSNIFTLDCRDNFCLRQIELSLRKYSIPYIIEIERFAIASSWLEVLLITGISQQVILNAISNIGPTTIFRLKPQFIELNHDI